MILPCGKSHLFTIMTVLFFFHHRVSDVFAMPQSGTGVSVEAVDPVFQAKMLDMLRQTGRPEMVVGWYHSHPGFGCWLSGVDINTQQSFEALSERAGKNFNNDNFMLN